MDTDKEQCASASLYSIADRCIREHDASAEARRHFIAYIENGSSSSFMYAMTAIPPGTVRKWVSAYIPGCPSGSAEYTRKAHMRDSATLLESDCIVFSVNTSVTQDVRTAVSLSYSGYDLVRFSREGDMFRCVSYDIVTPLIATKLYKGYSEEDIEAFSEGVYETDSILKTGASYGGRVMSELEMFSRLDYMTQGGASGYVNIKNTHMV